MTIHWRQMSTAEKIGAVKTAWYSGISAREIAAHFDGATRNSVIGLYGRYPDDLAATPLKKPTKSVIAMVDAKARRNYTVRAPGTVRPADRNTAPAVLAYEWHVCGKPLVRLCAKQCKWPVNDAAVGETHLFCSAPAEGSYCETHTKRSLNPRSAR